MLRLNKFVSQKSKFVTRISSKLTFPEKLKGGRIERWADYWKQVILDYKSVATDTLKDCKEKPIKASFLGAVLASGYYAVKTNPDEVAFQDQLKNANINLLMVSDAIRNSESESHVRFLNSCVNAGLLRKMSLGFFSFMWVSDYHPDCQIYGAQCSFLQPQYLTFYQRIVDVGFLGEWFVLRGKMIDYDVNSSEWG